MTGFIYPFIMNKRSYELLRRHVNEKASDVDDAKERKRRQIIAAATELFVQQGYRKTSISEVAELAGVAKGTIYLYVKTKAELMAQAVREELRRYVGVLEPILTGDASPRQKLRDWLRTALVVNTEMPLVSRLIGGDREIHTVLAELDQSDQQRALDVQMTFVRDILDEAATPHRWSASELTDRARVLIGVLYSASHFSDPWIRGELPMDRFAELLTDMLVDGVANVKE
jgi:AcrR family transcriptional regulator